MLDRQLLLKPMTQKKKKENTNKHILELFVLIGFKFLFKYILFNILSVGSLSNKFR